MLSFFAEKLFCQSERAAEAGAKVIFWSEGNAVLRQDNERAFMDRAARFAAAHGVWFAPAMVVMRYGSTVSDNKMVMFAPDGAYAYTYVKTKSWYPTGSDGWSWRATFTRSTGRGRRTSSRSRRAFSARSQGSRGPKDY